MYTSQGDLCCCYAHYMHAIITVETATSSLKANFLKEIETMKKVSGTGNELSKFVVNMVGCCTMQEPLLLVLEYIKHGDLLTYLRSRRQKGNVNHLYQFLCMHTMTIIQLFHNIIVFILVNMCICFASYRLRIFKTLYHTW